MCVYIVLRGDVIPEDGTKEMIIAIANLGGLVLVLAPQCGSLMS